jgi:hypothetical protein
LTSLSIEFLAEDVAPMLRSDVYHCHEFVKAVAGLLQWNQWKQVKIAKKQGCDAQAPDTNLVEESKRVLGLLRECQGDAECRKHLIEQKFGTDELGKDFGRELARVYGTMYGLTEIVKDIRLRPDFERYRWLGSILQGIDRAIMAVEYISDDAERYYFGKAQEYIAQGVVQMGVAHYLPDSSVDAPIVVIDLPSFPDAKTRFIALNSVLSAEWERARSAWENAMEEPSDQDERVPTFIVVEEAHNLIPLDPRGLAAEALREQFRTIAAEGRKYGLFLILCTQRPDKIDPLVLSECENQAIMRLGSRSVLEITKKLFGLEDIPSTTLAKCLEFEIGRVLLIGRWADADSPFLYCAMRRTVEGGRNLREEHWASPRQILGYSSKEIEL